jgi:hypothetical protein
LLPDGGELAIDGCRQIVQEDVRIAVRVVETIPTDWQGGLVGKIEQERRFAITGGGGNHDQFVLEMIVKEVDQAGAMEQSPISVG